MRRRSRLAGVVLAFLGALAVASAATAHVTLAPPFVELGAPTTISFETPNERDARVTVELELTAPAGVELAAAEAPRGWRLELSDRTARWVGGRIEGETTVSFPLVVTAQRAPGTEVFTARQRYSDGRTVRWRAGLSVLPTSDAEPPRQRLDRALVAGVVGLAVIAGSLLVLRRVRRR